MPDISRKAQGLELGVFLSLILPAMILSAAAARPGDLTFPDVAISTMLGEIPLLCLVFYFVWRNGEGPGALGLTFRNAWKEIGIGVALFVPVMVGMTLILQSLKSGGLSVPEKAPAYLVPSGTGQYVLAVILLIVVAVSEEVIFRGYLIRRFNALARNPGAALLLSSIIFAMGHGYQQSGGVVGVGILGLVFGAVYLWRGSLVAPMVMHFIQNFFGMILVPGGLTG